MKPSSLKMSGQFTSIGGQAVIEGVMMRSPSFIAVAVRRSDQHIVIRFKSYLSVSNRYPLLRKPLLRGVVTLIESMVQGMSALSYSASVATGSESQSKELSNWAIAGSIFMAVLLGMGLFVALPHLITVALSAQGSLNLTVESPGFHLLDGVFKISILLSYVYLIAMMKDIHRVFQYHGAEHKSIYAFEAGEDLTVENARRYGTLHPRCGTSFLFFLILISIGVFSLVFPFFHLTHVFFNPILNHFFMIFVKIVLMLPVAGIAYEFIKACSFRMQNPIFRILIWPGMILQKFTTREPSDDQLEIALASLKQVLRLEKNKKDGIPSENNDINITQFADMGGVEAQVAQFPEK